MPLDYDKIHYSSQISAYTKVQEGSFSVTVSGTISGGGNAQFTGSLPVTVEKGTIKLYAKQNPVPSSVLIYYDNTMLLPMPPTGVSTGFPFFAVGCSVSGDPSVTLIDVLSDVSISNTEVGVTLSIDNFSPGTMTLTETVFTFYFSVFALTEVS